MDRVLGEDYKQLWFDLEKAAEERKEYLKLHPPQPRLKPRPVQRELHSVFMSEGNRRLVEDIIRGSGISNDVTSSAPIEQDSNEDAASNFEDITESETKDQVTDQLHKHEI